MTKILPVRRKMGLVNTVQKTDQRRGNKSSTTTDWQITSGIFDLKAFADITWLIQCMHMQISDRQNVHIYLNLQMYSLHVEQKYI